MDFGGENITKSATDLISGLSFGSNITNGLFGLLNSGLNYIFSKKFANQQNKMQLDWWNMQNEYNSPKNQIKRLVEAGLNPNLAYGQLSSSNAGDVGTPAVAQMQFNNDIGKSLVSGLQQTMSLLSQSEDLRRKRLENDNLFDELISYPDSYKDMYGNEFLFDSRTQWYKFLNKMKAHGIFNNVYRGYLTNDYNSRTLQDRIDFQRFSRKLRERAANYQLLKNQLIEKEKSWYDANQIFNMVNTGINTVMSNFVMPFIPKNKLRRIIGTSGGHSFEREFQY